MEKKLLIIIIALLGVIAWYQIPSSLPVGGGLSDRVFDNASSTAYTVGPANSIQVMATTSQRLLLRFENISNCGSVFLGIENDIPAVINDGVVVASSSSYQQIGFPLYTGSVQAITDCAASSTLLVTEAEY